MRRVISAVGITLGVLLWGIGLLATPIEASGVIIQPGGGGALGLPPQARPDRTLQLGNSLNLPNQAPIMSDPSGIATALYSPPTGTTCTGAAWKITKLDGARTDAPAISVGFVPGAKIGAWLRYDGPAFNNGIPAVSIFDIGYRYQGADAILSGAIVATSQWQWFPLFDVPTSGVDPNADPPITIRANLQNFPTGASLYIDSVTSEGGTLSTTGQPVIVPVLANDCDPEGDPISLTSVAAPVHGTATILGGEAIEYTPNPGFSGVESFNYTITDSTGSQGIGLVTITVTSAGVQCLPGTYSATGFLPCTPAQPGFYVDAAGATSQTACPAGTYSNGEGSILCTAVPAGSYSPAGAVAPTPCPAGTYSATGGAASCTTTPAGSFSLPGAIAPTLCDRGFFSANAGGATCTPAPAGSYVPVFGAISATLCPAGTFSSVEGSILCSLVPAGSYSPTGAAAPTPCPAGTYSAIGGAASCTTTPAGSYSPPASTAPMPCAPGSYSDVAGAATCTSAPVDMFVATTGAVSATACPVGTSTNGLTGQTSCTPIVTPCAAGTFSATGNTPCIPAPAGSYVSSTGATSATPCPAGTYSGTTGAVSCLPVPGGTYSPAGATAPTPWSTCGSNQYVATPGTATSDVVCAAKLATTTTVTFGAGPFPAKGSAATATASVAPAAAGIATIAYSGDCVSAGGTCMATATYAGNSTYLPSSASASITITAVTPRYTVCAVRDDDEDDDRGGSRRRGHEIGSTIAVRIRICDANGRNVGSRSLTVTAIGLSPTGTLASPGRSNPNNAFRFDDGQYVFNLSTRGLTVGNYTLDFTIGADPTVHHWAFTLGRPDRDRGRDDERGRDR